MAKRRSNIGKFLALSDHEKMAAVEESAKATSHPLTSAEREKWNEIQAALKSRHRSKGRGRPVTGAGIKVISLSVERKLLARADALAKRKGISRAALVARGLRAVMAS